jgi:hypothetical protein
VGQAAEGGAGRLVRRLPIRTAGGLPRLVVGVRPSHPLIWHHGTRPRCQLHCYQCAPPPSCRARLHRLRAGAMAEQQLVAHLQWQQHSTCRRHRRHAHDHLCTSCCPDRCDDSFPSRRRSRRQRHACRHCDQAPRSHVAGRPRHRALPPPPPRRRHRQRCDQANLTEAAQCVVDRRSLVRCPANRPVSLLLQTLQRPTLCGCVQPLCLAYEECVSKSDARRRAT